LKPWIRLPGRIWKEKRPSSKIVNKLYRKWIHASMRSHISYDHNIPCGLI
jgi:hypothetical protein